MRPMAANNLGLDTARRMTYFCRRLRWSIWIDPCLFVTQLSGDILCLLHRCSLVRGFRDRQAPPLPRLPHTVRPVAGFPECDAWLGQLGLDVGVVGGEHDVAMRLLRVSHALAG